MRLQDLKLKFTFYNDLNTTYKVIEFEEELELVDYQIEMIRTNQIEGLLSLNARFKDNNLQIYYDITSKQELGEVIKRIELDKNEILDLIEGIVKILLNAENYLLNSAYFLIDSKHMYLNPKTKKVSLMYLPVKMEQNINESVKNFMIQLIVYEGKFKDKEAEVVGSQILNALKDDGFSLKKLSEKLKEIRLSESTSEISDLRDQRFNKQKIEKQIKPKSIEAMIDVKHQNEEKTPDPIRIGKKNYSIPREEFVKEEIQYKTKKRLKKSVLIKGITLQLIILFLLIFFGEKVISFAGGDRTSYIAIGVFVFAIEGILFKRIFSIDHVEEIQVKNTTKEPVQKKVKKMKLESDTEKQNLQKVTMNKKTIDYESLNCHQESRNHNPLVYGKGFMNFNEDTTLLNQTLDQADFEMEETTLLSASMLRPYLSRINGKGIERIDLVKSNFVIGRQRDVVDYVIQEQAVGRMHTEFIIENGNCFVKDLNSRNGTFVNDERITGNQSIQINQGDSVKIANIDFTFNVEK